VPVIGSLGVVLRSREKGHIDRASPVIDKLMAAGMFLDDEFVRRVLASAGE